MREAINDMELDQVVGGCVNLSKSKMKIGFTTLHEGYDLKCTWSEAYALVTKLFAENDLSEKSFDSLVKKEFRNRGWI